MRKRSTITLEDNQGRTQNRVAIFEQLYERVIDWLVGHAVDEHVRAFFHRRARRIQFRRVDSDTYFVRVTFFYRCAHDWPETFNRVLLVDDVPNLHKIGFLFSQFAYESARLIRRVYFDDWGIT